MQTNEKAIDGSHSAFRMCAVHHHSSLEVYYPLVCVRV